MGPQKRSARTGNIVLSLEPLPEAKHAFQARCKYNKIWGRVCAWMDTQQVALKKSGLTKVECRHQAFLLAMERWPIEDHPPKPKEEPKPKEKPAEPMPEPDLLDELKPEELNALIERSSQGSMAENLERDREWVYRNLGNPRAHPRDAPSFGAWALFKAATANPQKFLDTMKPAPIKPAPAAKPKEETPAPEPEEPEVDETLEMTRRLLEEERAQ